MAVIRMMVKVKAPAREVFSLVASSAGLARWWTSAVTDTDGSPALSVTPGSERVQFRAATMVLPVRVVWTAVSTGEWDKTQLLFELDETPDGCRVHFTHAGWRGQTDWFLEWAARWGVLMWHLRDVAEGTARSPLFPGGQASAD